MNVVRMNTAHATEDGIRTIVKNVRAVSPHIGIMIDTKGPEVRTTDVKEPIHYNIGDVVKIFGRPDVDSSHDIVNLSYPDIAADLKVGDDILFDDGELDMKVVDIQGPMLVAEVQNEGTQLSLSQLTTCQASSHLRASSRRCRTLSKRINIFIITIF